MSDVQWVVVSDGSGLDDTLWMTAHLERALELCRERLEKDWVTKVTIHRTEGLMAKGLRSIAEEVDR